MTAEHDRLDEARDQKAPWKKWGRSGAGPAAAKRDTAADNV